MTWGIFFALGLGLFLGITLADNYVSGGLGMSWNQFFAICTGCFVGNVLGRILIEWWATKLL